MTSLILKLENYSISFFSFIITFLSIIIIRAVLENFASLKIFSEFFVWTTFFHMILWFTAVFLSIAIVLYFFTRESILKIIKLQLFFWPIIWLSMIIDIFIGKGGEGMYYYLFPSSIGDFFNQSILFLITNSSASLGLKIEIVFIIVAVIAYVYLKTKSIIKSISSGLISYFILGAYGSIPGFIFILEKAIGYYDYSYGNSVLDFYQNVLLNYQNLIIGKGYFTSLGIYLKKMNSIWNLIFLPFIFINIIIEILLIGYFWNKEKFFTLVKNIRIERLFHYWLMIFCGMLISYSLFHQLPFFTSFNIFAIISLFLTVFFAWISAAGYNDIADIKGDAISNADRPLVGGKFNLIEFKNINFIFLFLSLIGATLTNYYTLIFILISHIVAYLYSFEPFRLKRFPIVNSFCIALVSLFMTMAGFFIISPTLALANFPIKVILLILIYFTLVANFKDLKDVKGDSIDGVKTIPVIFGEKKGKIIIGILMLLAFISAPIIVNKYSLILYGLIFGAMAFWLVNKKKYDEKLVFLVYFIYFLIIILNL